MYNRLISLPKNRSFFLFGQRGTGKSTLLKIRLLDKEKNNTTLIDLLDSRTYLELSRDPSKIRERVEGFSIVVIDEIQKIPLLLDEVHRIIEEGKNTGKTQFILTGSSARKLKRAGVNLLGGRAAEYKLFPFSYKELKQDFNLKEALQWGLLPEVVTLDDLREKEDFLYAYVDTYLKEEIILESVVRQIEPFSRFLEIAAQCNGESIVYENIAKDVSVGAISVKNYYDILIDTLIGFSLPSFHTSIRKRQKKSSKFYFYDNGLVRALQNLLGNEVLPRSFEFGKLFESFIINECIKLDSYNRTRYQFSHLRISDKDEIDLIIERPGKPIVLIEIKSKNTIDERDCKTLNRLSDGFKNPVCYLLSLDDISRQIDKVQCREWRVGLEEIFL